MTEPFKARDGSRRRTKESSKQPWIAGTLAVLVAAGLAAAILWHSHQHARQATVAARAVGGRSQIAVAPEDWALPGDLPPLPVPKATLPREARAVRAAYEFAARHSEVLGQLPCFCGCQKLGHRSNHDCFVAGRSADGRLAWDAHGMG